MGHFQPTSASAGGSGFWLFSAWPSSPWASLKLKQRQLPIQRLILIFFMEATTALDIITATVATLPTESMARGLLKLKLKLSLPLKLRPRLKLIPGMDTTVDTVMDTTVDMVLGTTVDTTVDTMATPNTDTMVDMVLDTMVDTTVDTMATPTEATTESMVLDTMVDTT